MILKIISVYLLASVYKFKNNGIKHCLIKNNICKFYTSFITISFDTSNRVYSLNKVKIINVQLLTNKR